MARYLGPKCKLSRREGTDLFLKSGIKPLDAKCKLETPPGTTVGQRRGRLSDYGLQLREKQKLRRMYGVSKPVKSCFPNRFSGATGKASGTPLVAATGRAMEILQSLRLIQDDSSFPTPRCAAALRPQDDTIAEEKTVARTCVG